MRPARRLGLPVASMVFHQHDTLPALTFSSAMILVTMSHLDESFSYSDIYGRAVVRWSVGPLKFDLFLSLTLIRDSGSAVIPPVGTCIFFSQYNSPRVLLSCSRSQFWIWGDLSFSSGVYLVTGGRCERTGIFPSTSDCVRRFLLSCLTASNDFSDFARTKLRISEV